MAVADRHDFAALPPLGRADGRAPFFAAVNVASMNPSVRFSLPRSRRSSVNRWSTRSSTLVRRQCWNRRWHVWYGGYRSGRSFQGAPVRSIQSTPPFNTSRASRHGRPRPSARRVGFNNGASTVHCVSARSMPSSTMLFNGSLIVSRRVVLRGPASHARTSNYGRARAV
jgi:hypothetical protein